MLQKCKLVDKSGDLFVLELKGRAYFQMPQAREKNFKSLHKVSELSAEIWKRFKCFYSAVLWYNRRSLIWDNLGGGPGLVHL